MQPILQVKNIRKTYDAKNYVLDDIDFTISKGEVVVILGPSGCGKSTFLRCLNRLEEINAGQLILKGEDITYSGNLSQIRQNIGMVFQNYELFPNLTVLENILLAPTVVLKEKKAQATQQALQLLNRVGLEEKAQAYPRQLSGGQKQRVAIVRALIMRPEILLLDEITAALDPEMVREVLQVVLELASEHKTMVIVTHEMAFAQAVANRILFLDKGKVVEEATPDEFFTHPQTLRAQQFLNTFHYDMVNKGEKDNATL